MDLVYMVTSPLVPAFGEAKARDDWKWIAVMAKPLIRIWAGPEAVPHTSLILWLSLYNLLGVLLMGGAQLLIGLERLAPLVLSVTLCALGTIGLGILFGRSIGLSGVAMAMAVSKLAFLFPIQIWAVRRLLTTKRVDPAKVAGEAAV